MSLTRYRTTLDLHYDGFLAVIAFAVGFCFFTITNAYMGGLVVTIIVSLGISAVSMQAVARTIEGRYLWPPRKMYYGFIYGDLLCLPTIAAMLCLLHEHPAGHSLINDWWWRLVIIVGSIVLASVFRASETGKYYGSTFTSPTKLWHDIFVMTVFLYFLASQAPLIYSSRWGILGIMQGYRAAWVVTITIFVAFLGWLILAGYWDGRHPKPDAHVSYTWRQMS